jgi:hypothetical protein
MLTFKTHDSNHEPKTNPIERKPKKIIKQNTEGKNEKKCNKKKDP